ncbi:hypothetical protein C2G38_2030915 [Gigaspora rosea]|uniref:CCHC-type domain-containing protein n=1 Tax=Gigaspora rosea TaxID=44941 RepID=A0A397VST2_9GLOM|nr:hypothetical protein C2G38_2030915 [Gigaspora rosea]
MFDPNLPTFSSDLIYQLAQHIQQLQTSSSPNPAVPHQPLKKNIQYQNEVYCETSCQDPIIHLQPLQQQLFQDPQQYSRSQPTNRKLCFNCQKTSHPILECPNIKLLGQKCSTLLQTLSSEQLDDFQEIIKETFPDGLNNNQVPEVLEFMLKVIENIIKVDSNKEAEKIIHPPLHIKIPNIEAQAVNPFSKGKPSGTQGFELYCIPELQEKGNSEILVNNNEDLEEKGIELNPEVVLDKLLTICLEALKWLPGFENLKPESNSPLRIINGGNDLGHTYEISTLDTVIKMK